MNQGARALCWLWCERAAWQERCAGFRSPLGRGAAHRRPRTGA